MSEIDKSEALADFEKLRDLLIILASVILAGAVFTAYYFALSLTRPIRVLADMAENLSSGNWTKVLKFSPVTRLVIWHETLKLCALP